MPERVTPRVLLTTYYDRDVIAGPLERLGGSADIVDVGRGRCLTREELVGALPGVHVTVAADENYDADVLDAATDLALIARDGTGYETIDLDAATERGILVTRAPVVHFCTANLVIGLMLAVVRKIPLGNRGVREGQWTDRAQWLCPDVTGMTLGIVGFGQVGREVAKRAQALGMKVVCSDLADVSAAATALGVEVRPLDELLGEADVVTVHIRHTDATAGLFNADLFAKMERGAYFVNTSRGGIVDEPALVDALASGRLAGAALDVFVQEPTPVDNPLLAFENVVATPHVAGDTTTTMAQAVEMNVTQILDCLAGRKPDHLLNPDAWAGARVHALRSG